MRQYEDEIKEA